LFVLFANLWIWRAFSLNFIIGTLMLATSIFFHLTLSSSKISKISLLFLVLLLIFQWQTTNKVSLTYLDNDEQRVQKMRLQEYPPIHITFANKNIWIPVAHWFEERNETIVAGRIANNFFQTIDINQYFFASHPRERVGVKEFEKFPYFFLLPFLYGLALFLTKFSKKQFLVFLFLPLGLLSLVGYQNDLGPYSLFPFFVSTIFLGTKDLHDKFFKKFPLRVKAIIIILILLIFIQTIGYASN